MQSDQDDFRRNRDQFAIEIRKTNRQEIFTKRRQISQNQSNNKCSTPIVDERFKLIILELQGECYSPEQIEELCLNLDSNDVTQRLRAVMAIRRIISQKQNESNIQRVIDCGAVPILIQMLKQSFYPQLQLQSCWILSNIASGSHTQCESVINKQGLDGILQLLLQPNIVIIQQALWCIGNIAGDTTMFRDMIIMRGGVDCLVRIGENNQNMSVIRKIAWVLSNLCRGCPLPKYELIKPAIALLATVVVSGILDQSQLPDVLWALAYHSQGPKSKIQRLIEVNGFVSKLIQFCNQLQSSAVIVASLRIMGHISTGNERQTEQLLIANILDSLNQLLSLVGKSIRRQICWIISNICAGNQSQVGRVLANKELLGKLSVLLLTDEADVKTEICYIYSNMCHLGNKVAVYEALLEGHILQGVIGIICNEQDTKALQSALKALFQLLKLGGKISKQNIFLLQVQRNSELIQRIQALQHHQSRVIYNSVFSIINQYFSLEEQLF